MPKATIKEIKSFVSAYIAAAKQAGTWSPDVDTITGLIEKVRATFTLDNGAYIDNLPELSGTMTAGILEEYAAGLIPAGSRPTDGSNDELAPARLVFDDPSYSYVLKNADGTPGIRFKVTTDKDWFDRFLATGNEDEIVMYILMKLEQSGVAFKYASKRQLIGNFIDKAVAANAGETYTQNSTILKCGHIYVESSKYYIMKVNKAVAVNKTLATIAGTDHEAVEITPSMVQEIAKPVDTATAEAFIKAVKDAVEKLSISETEGTSLSGSTIGAQGNLRLYLAPGIQSVLDVDALAGAFNVDKLALPATVKVLPDFGTITNNTVFAVLLDEQGCKLFDNYEETDATVVKGSRYTNWFKHYGGTAFISKHTAIKVFKPGA